MLDRAYGALIGGAIGDAMGNAGVFYDKSADRKGVRLYK